MPVKTTPANASQAPKAVATCPVERAIHVIGGKWKLLVLRSLLLNGPQGYNQLLLSVAGISSKELTRNLAELTACGLTERDPLTADRITPYHLTESGKALMPTFESLLLWGQRALPLDHASRNAHSGALTAEQQDPKIGSDELA